jgi:hypothetical protein
MGEPRFNLFWTMFVRNQQTNLEFAEPSRIPATRSTLTQPLYVDPIRGWVNNGRYGQRNPNGAMSVLADGDFSFIRDFFEVA